MENEISHKIIGAAIEVHRVLGGPGLLEGIYESCLCHELALKGFHVQRQLAVPVKYKGFVVRDPLYIDILVEGLVIVEVKATEKLHPIHDVQLLTYLRLTSCKLGLLVNFGQEYVKDGTRRVVNGLQEAFFARLSVFALYYYYMLARNKNVFVCYFLLVKMVQKRH